jgi:hypothetical protein
MNSIIARIHLTKRNVIIIVSILALIILIFVGIIVFQNFYYRKALTNSWQQVVNQSTTFANTLDKVTTVDQVKGLSLNIDELNSTINYQEDVLASAGSGRPFAAKNNRAKTFLTEYQNYFQVCKDLIQNPNVVNEKGYADCKTVADNLKKSQEDLIKLTFISEQIPNGVFLMPDKIKKIQDDYQKQKNLDLQNSSQENQILQKTNQNAELAQNNLTKFMNYYIGGDEKNIRHYMTEAFENEFNFNDLSADSRDFSQPVSFRITSVEAINDSEFQIQGNLLTTNHYTDSFGNTTTNKYVQQLKFRLVDDPKYGLWLVDSMGFSGNNG